MSRLLTRHCDSAILDDCLASRFRSIGPGGGRLLEVQALMVLKHGTTAARLARIALTAALGWLTAGTLPAAPLPADPGLPGFCAALDGPDPYFVDLVPTANANGARGTVRLHFADSPFGVTVTADGHHSYAADIRVTGLAANGDALVVWAATPSLDQVARIGALGADGRVEGAIAFNKFLVFITAEAAADVERWSGPILLRGASPSARLHTMVGHGPFTTESCREWGFGPPGGGTPDRTPWPDRTP